MFIIACFLLAFASINAFTSPKITTRAPRVKPVHENFFLDIAEDPAINTPKQILGEVAYKGFVEQYNPKALIVGKYDIIERVRELKLLSLTADSGLLEALEQKGLTLSQVEKLLPLVDNLGVLPLALKNKDLLISLAPLLIEPAPLLLPLVASVIKTPANSFLLPGAALISIGGIEAVSDHALLGVPLVLLGLPLFVLGSLLNGAISIPIPTEKEVKAATLKATANAKTDIDFSKSAPRVSSKAISTGKPRKMIKIN